MIIFEDERRYLRGLLELRLDNNLHAACGGCFEIVPGAVYVDELSAAHSMSRIHRITRKDGDVVMLGGIERDIHGVQLGLLSGGSASAVSEVASRSDVISAAGIKNGLALLARDLPHAALSYDRHVAGVEVSAEDRRHT